MSTLIVPQAVYDAFRAHGEETYPHECCGALLGRSDAKGWRVTESMRAGNTRTDSAHNRYHIAPVELVQHPAERARQGAGDCRVLSLASRPSCAVVATDFAEAHWLGCSYVITSVAQGKATVTNSFLLAGANEEEKRFEDQAIEVEELACAKISWISRRRRSDHPTRTESHDDFYSNAATNVRGRQRCN